MTPGATIGGVTASCHGGIVPKSPVPKDRPATPETAGRARDHLANERTFLAWVRTGIAIVVFGFAIGRFAIAIDEWQQIQGQSVHKAAFSVWFGAIAIVAGVLLTLAGLVRFRRIRAELQRGRFEARGFVINVVGILTAAFGLALGAYLIMLELGL